MASRHPNIIARFAIDGIDAVGRGLRRLETSIRDAASRAGRATTDLARRAGTAIRREFANAASDSVAQVTKRIEQATAGLKKLATATKTVGFSAMEKSAKAAFIGIGAAAAAAGAKVAAAMAITSSSATDLSKMDLTNRQTGVSVQDQAALRGIAGLQGTDPDSLFGSLQTVSATVRELERNRDLNQDAQSRSRGFLRYGLGLALQTGDADSLNQLIEASKSTGMADIKNVEYRMKRLEAVIRSTQRGRIASNLANQYLKDGADTQGIEAMRKAQAELLLPLVLQFQQLLEASKALRESMGPAGRALEDLKEVGLDADVALGGGVEALEEIAEAIQKFDSARQVELVRGLFGDTTQLPVLRQGREGVRRYQADMERYGGKVTDADGEAASELKRAELVRNTAIGGAKLEIARELTPILIETNRAFADWLAANRKSIAVWTREAFVEITAVVRDIAGLFSGDKSFESALFTKGQAVVDWAMGAYNKAKEVAIAVTALVFDVLAKTYTEFQKVMSGQDSEWAWLNYVRDGFVAIADAVRDVVAVFSGGEAVRFEWLNQARAVVLDFLAHLKEAWGMFKRVLDVLHSGLKVIGSFLGTDVLTTALFLGMLRFSGILGAMVGTVRILFGLAGGLSTAFGAAFATMATAAAAVVGQVALIGATLLASWKIGEWLGGKLIEPLVNRDNKIQDDTARLMRMQDKAYGDRKYASMTRDQQLEYRAARGYDNYGVMSTGQRNAAAQAELDARKASGRILTYADTGSSPEERLRIDDMLQKARSRQSIDLNFKINGKTFSGRYDEQEGNGLVSELRRAVRLD
ncbi:hypothetical protein ASD54_08685 [Rhizobium sp. Root149]|uniref:hypothetical protein n=1 Tax=Rhizobium sp. Root149 TaxID=1736473 RepID=UPI0007144FA0|nr:hypothetical protein [Rhizobium sp. Root149]KQZ50321.1 hypothetical protein ASD54_08685 [Rhizobium sp. Root149]